MNCLGIITKKSGRHLCCKCVFLLLLILCLVREGGSNLVECCSYLNKYSIQPESIRKGAEACCPYLTGGFNQFNLQTLKQNCTYFRLKGLNISKLISANEPKILFTNVIVSYKKEDHRSFFCYSDVNPDTMEFMTEDGKSYKDLNNTWKNVHTYQLSCGILLIFSPIESCQYNTVFKCVVKSNDTHPHMEQASIKSVFSFNISQSNDSVHKGAAKNLTCKLKILNKNAVASFEIVFQHFNNMSGEYRSINNSEIFLLNPTEHTYNNDKTILILQRSLTISCSPCVKDVISCILLDKACGLVRRLNYFLQDAMISYDNTAEVIFLWSGITFIFIVICLAFLSFLFVKIHLKRHLSSKELFMPCTRYNKKNQLISFIKGMEEFRGESIVEEGKQLQSSNEEPPTYNVFISYSSKNREWVKNTLLNELERRDVKVCIDFRDFSVGEYISKNIIDGIHNSRKTIAVLSTDYLESDYCKDELRRALQGQHVISISIENCMIPDSLKETVLKLENNDKFWKNLVAAIHS